MEILIICIAIIVILFVASFITKRRFGLLGLALSAGSLLSSIWGFDIVLAASGFGIPETSLSTAIIMSLIILLPAGILLFHGYTYKNHLARIFGSIFFSILAFAFLLEPLGQILVPSGPGSDVFQWLLDNRNLVIGVGLIFAVIDLFLTKPHLSNKKSKY